MGWKHALPAHESGVSVRSVGDGGILEGLKHFEKLLIGVIVVLAGDNAVGQRGRERPVVVRILTLTHAVAQLSGQRGQRLGNIKPAVLNLQGGWDKVFKGEYL